MTNIELLTALAISMFFNMIFSGISIFLFFSKTTKELKLKEKIKKDYEDTIEKIAFERNYLKQKLGEKENDTRNKNR